MNSKDLKWFNEDFALDPFGENGVLFTAEYLAFYNFPQEYKDKVKKLIEIHLDSNNNWFNPDTLDPLSHDNRTAIVILSIKYGFDYHKRVFEKSLIHSMLHPRDFIFYTIFSNNWYSIFFKPFYIISLLPQMYSCSNTYKIINGQRVHSTDGKLLIWLKCKSLKLKYTSKFCSYILRNFANLSWKEVFSIYFKNTNHPLNRMSGDWYEL